MDRLLAVSGKMASGKDTVATRTLRKLQLEWERVNLADSIRDELQRCYELAAENPDFVRSRLEEWASNDVERETVEQLVMLAASGGDVHERTSGNRVALQQLAWLGRQHDPDIWLRRHHDRVAAALAADGGRVILTTDVREPDEVVSLHSQGFLLVRLIVSEETQLRRLRRRDGLTADHSLHHPNETALDRLSDTMRRRFALIVDNDGAMEDTVEKIAHLLTERWGL